MKRKLFGLALAAAVATPLVTLTSCSDDDKAEVVTPDYIRVYNTEISFNDSMTEAIIQGIVSNVDIEVASYPTWIESVTLEAVNGGEFYTALVKLKAADYDDEVREGVITFKAISSDLSADYTIKCDPNSFSIKLDWGSEFDNIFDSDPEVTGAISKSIVTIVSKPGYDVELRAFEQMGFRYNENPSEYVTITEIPSTRAAYNVKSYEVSFALYPFVDMWTGSTVREFRIFAIPVNQLEIFNPNSTSNEDYKDARQYRNDIVRVDESSFIVIPNEGGSADFTFQASEECEVSLGDLNWDDNSVNPPSFDDFTITKKSQSEVVRGLVTYVYTVTLGQCPESLEWGRYSNIIIQPTSDRAQTKQISLEQSGWY